jgi:hypothetical protein
VMTRDLVDREGLRRKLQANRSAYERWSFYNAIHLLDAMPAVECPRGWTRDEVLHDLDTHPGAVAKALGTRSGAWYELRRSDIADWHPKARFYDVRVVLPKPSEPLREMQYEQARAVLSVPVVRDALAVAATHDAEILRLIDERDEAQEWADRLAAVAGGPDVVGEHSNANSPWANALELLQGERG